MLFLCQMTMGVIRALSAVGYRRCCKELQLTRPSLPKQQITSIFIWIHFITKKDGYPIGVMYTFSDNMEDTL